MINIKLCITLVILLFFIINYNHYLYNGSNYERHRNTDSLYDHFSKIDSYNYLIFPKLFFAHPVNYVLKKGQSIYIPKKWWHWIKTT